MVAALGALDGQIDAERMRGMNLAVDGQGRLPVSVAAELLDTLGPRGAGTTERR